MLTGQALNFSVFKGASLTGTTPGSIDLETPGENHGPAAIARLEQPIGSSEPVVGTRVSVDLEIDHGKVGVVLLNGGGGPICEEVLVEGAGRRRVVVECKNGSASSLLFRSSDRGASKARIFGIASQPLRRFSAAPIIEDVLPVLLRAPGETALSSIAHAISARSGKVVNASDIAELDLSGLAVPLPIAAPPLESIFDDDVGREIIAETKRLLTLLPRARLDKLGEFLSKLDIDFYKLYFKCTIIRIYHVVHLLRDLEMRNGTILEIGSFMGNFSATLQRLGYNVTSVDRYRFYQGGLDVYTEYMRSLGIQVEEMTREDEAERMAGLGQYDAVISMAVVEHIPPPVRPFLEMLASHVKPGGLLVLDTPNIAHYWNRVKLARGESIHQDLETQYYSTPPWEGHHREYTPSELRWMLEQVGGRDIKLRLFDLRMLEWEQFSPAKLQELLAMSLDPTLCVTMLAGGRILKQ